MTRIICEPKLNAAAAEDEVFGRFSTPADQTFILIATGSSEETCWQFLHDVSVLSLLSLIVIVNVAVARRVAVFAARDKAKFLEHSCLKFVVMSSKFFVVKTGLIVRKLSQSIDI